MALWAVRCSVPNELTGIVDVTQQGSNRTLVSDMEGHVLYSEQADQIQRQLVVNGEVLGRYGHIRDEDNPSGPNGAPNFLSCPHESVACACLSGGHF